MRTSAERWRIHTIFIGSLAASMLLVNAATLAAPASATADQSCDVPDIRTDIRPNFGVGPTEVRFGALIADVTGVDDVAQTIEIDVFNRLQWRDTRFASLEGCRFHRSKLWHPNIELFNSHQMRKFRTFATDQVEVGAGGLITYFQRNAGPVATYHELHKFPFDRQHFALRVGAIEYDSSEVKVVADTKFTKLSNKLNIPDWSIENASIESRDLFMEEFGKDISVAILTINASRHSKYYVRKVLIPLALIVFMSWTVFWIDPVKHGPQIGVAATSMLTLIAFQFATTAILPRLSYLTTLDQFLLGSTILVFLALIEVTIITSLVAQGKENLARRVNAGARWIFPIGAVAWWTYLLARL